MSAIVFGLTHLTNYTSVGAWWYGPILVLPQLIGGLTFGYVRIRLGFWFAVLAHILTNLLYTLGDGMNALFGDAGGAVWLAILVLSATALVAWTFKKKPVTI